MRRGHSCGTNQGQAMIITGKARRNGNQLGRYLTAQGENENVRVLDIKGASTGNAAEAVFEFSLQNELTKRGKNGLYHASISPAHGEDSAMTYDDWIKSADVLEKKLGLEGQNRVLVWHEKRGKDGKLRQHVHCVWQREKDGKLIKMSHNYRQHDSARRTLEKEFGHKLTRQPLDLKQALTDIWNQAKDGQEVMDKAKKIGVTIAQGVRRAYTAIDSEGQKLDFVRQLIGVKTRDVKEKLQGLESRMRHENEFEGPAAGSRGRKAEARKQRQQQERPAPKIAGEKEKDQTRATGKQAEAKENFEGVVERAPTLSERIKGAANENKQSLTEFQRRREKAWQNSKDDNDLSREL